MAIYPDYPGLIAEDVVDDLTLTEYSEGTEAPPTDTVAKYIRAVFGANIAIRFVVANSCFAKCSILADLQIDGKSMHRAIGREDIEALCEWTRHGMAQAFRFSQLDIDEGSTAGEEDTKSHISSTGPIKVRFQRVANVRRRVIMPQRLPTLPEHEIIPKKALKGSVMTNATSLDPPQPSGYSHWSDVDYVDGIDFPFVTFRFEYRSLGEHLFQFDQVFADKVVVAALRSLHLSSGPPGLDSEIKCENGNATIKRKYDTLIVGKQEAEEDSRPAERTSAGAALKQEDAEEAVGGMMVKDGVYESVAVKQEPIDD